MYYFEITLTMLFLVYLKIFIRIFSKNIKATAISILIPLTSLTFGIIIQKKFNMPVNCLLIITGIIIVIIAISSITKLKIIQMLSISVIPIAIGAILLYKQENEFKSKIKFIPTKNINLIGEVLGKENKEPYKEIIKIELKKLFRNSYFKYFNKSEKIILYSKNETTINPGDIINVQQINLSIPNQNVALNGNPSFRDYVIKENIIATSFINNPKYEIIEPQNRSTFSKLIRWKNYLYKKIKNKFSKKTFSYFSSIFLGNKSNNLNQKEKNYFMFWGISHYLARSGLHIAIFILIWDIILSLMPLYFFLKQIIFVSICLIYATISWSSISFLRALTVFLLYKIGKILNKQTNILYLLSITCMFYLCMNPYLLFFLDFQLSFGLTIAIAASFSK